VQLEAGLAGGSNEHLLAKLSPTLFLVIGLFMAFHPMLLSGLSKMQADPGDTRFVNYILEHGYRWLRAEPGHDAFWDPPFFYPAKNAAAYSEILIGGLPLYVPWRLLGVLPDTAFQFWMLLVSILNFVAAYLLLRNCFGLTRLASSAGSFIFAFGSPRIVELSHQQLLPHFYSVFAVYAAARIFQSARAPARWRAWWIFALFGSIVAQLYAGFYLGWFLLLGLGVAALVALSLREPRKVMIEILTRNWMTLLGSAGLAAAALAPMASHYIIAGEQMGYRRFAEISAFLPRIQSWIYQGSDSWLYGWMRDSDVFKAGEMGIGHGIGVGLFTSAAALAGLWITRKQLSTRVMALTAAIIIVCVTLFPGNSGFWEHIYPYIPGAAAIRVVSRVSLLLLIPASIGVACFINSAPLKKYPILAAIVAIVCVAEQGHKPQSYDKLSARRQVESLAALVERDSDAFFYSPARGNWPPWKYHIDGMWAQMITGVPTVNGHSGAHPPQWGLFDNIVVDAKDEARILAALRDWANLHQRDPERVRLVTREVEDCYSTDCARRVSSTVPTTLIAGRHGSGRVTIKNLGSQLWSAENGYSLICRIVRQVTVVEESHLQLPGSVPPGTEVTFDFRINTPSNPGLYKLEWRMARAGLGPFGEHADSPQIAVVDDHNSAEFVHQQAPAVMTAGKTYEVTATMRNIGKTTWTKDAGFKLASIVGAGGHGLGVSSIDLPGPVPPLHSVTFNFTVKAPQAAGDYDLQWRMMQERVGPFGDATPIKTIRVVK
jgi:hypothetical protein